jgi:SAM-dependent methyltransferase
MTATLVARLLLTTVLAAPLQQGAVTPPPISAEQEKRLTALPPDVQIYERYRYWAGFQPAEVRGDSLRHYEAWLASQGVAPEERKRVVDTIQREGRRLEVERWNRVLTADKPTFNTAPNAFLVEMIRGRQPGTALDVGMGQGRNAIYLAQQGWDVTGFDPAEKAVAQAQTTAAALGVKLQTVVQGSEDFPFGENKWDLVVLSYVTFRDDVERIVRALKPGGIVVVEGFHRDVTRTSSVGGGVVFDSNELLRLFAGLRVLRYEDADAKLDFGSGQGRVVRLCAMKE